MRSCLKVFHQQVLAVQIFREVTGRSPKQYLINWRIMKAKSC